MTFLRGFILIILIVFAGFQVIYAQWKFFPKNLAITHIVVFSNILQKLHAWEKFQFSSYSQKCLLANEISVFLNHQHFTYRLISGLYIWHVDRHERKKQGSLTGVLKNILIWGNGPFWAQKLPIHMTLDPQEEFCTMRRGNR